MSTKMAIFDYQYSLYLHKNCPRHLFPKCCLFWNKHNLRTPDRGRVFLRRRWLQFCLTQNTNFNILNYLGILDILDSCWLGSGCSETSCVSASQSNLLIVTTRFTNWWGMVLGWTTSKKVTLDMDIWGILWCKTPDRLSHASVWGDVVHQAP